MEYSAIKPSSLMRIKLENMDMQTYLGKLENMLARVKLGGDAVGSVGFTRGWHFPDQWVTMVKWQLGGSTTELASVVTKRGLQLKERKKREKRKGSKNIEIY